MRRLIVIVACACGGGREEAAPSVGSAALPAVAVDAEDPWAQPADAAAGSASSADVEQLRRDAIRLRSIAAADEDFSDLEPLRAVLSNARVVQLGEQTHGDGSTFEAKVRLVKFLHRELGFSVLAFESGFYDCAKAWEAIHAGKDPVDAARSAIFPLWSQSTQVQPLWRYLGTAAKTERPLVLAGFDSQFTGKLSESSLIDDLGTVIGAQAAAPLRRVVTTAPTSKAERERTRAAFAAAAKRVKGPRAEYWKQVLRSMATQAESDWADLDAGPMGRMTMATNRERDQQMADNLLWLLSGPYRDNKVIVWGATMHLMRNGSTLEERGLLGTSRPYEDLKTMGHHVATKLGAAVYTIGFLAYEGTWQLAGNEQMSSRIEPPPAGSFDDLFARAGLELGFLDLRGHRASWSKPRIARPLAYDEMTGDWTQVVDGFVFIKTMKPSTTAP